jgi:hypothetical protein
MVQTRSAGEARERWESNAGDRENYESGVENPLRGWQDSALGGAERWNEGVRQARENSQFSAGVNNSSDQEWQEKSLEVGGQRLRSGVTANVDKFESRLEEYISTIEDTELPAKGPAGDVDTNIERSRVMAQALRDQKTQG